MSREFFVFTFPPPSPPHGADAERVAARVGKGVDLYEADAQQRVGRERSSARRALRAMPRRMLKCYASVDVECSAHEAQNSGDGGPRPPAPP